ncbi:MAG: arginyl-tRNA synthetase [Microgenomates group bacterium GW2011_GWC1_37_8]|uniref:Arginine--tRNA ligase n=1 Tax=Candidatus Woesebacteria bacterium GW2011_GWB1_38_8 TaxID=1618570 RepID=A0A0G0NEK6_9BACT|nr:MAG: arginyl-tRNA synthetase [Microgenomates group bacterium GW2011_GWC1_37_8]KKQ84329.1 MAG: arginyl-tRNA synthetase [Candidatus Woesebacteria bacterium GW2011_GWB1_38_8]
MKEKIIKSLAKVTGIPETEIHLDVPEREEFGDYSSNIAMQLFSSAKNKEHNTPYTIHNSPHELAEEIVSKLKADKELEKIIEKFDIAEPGFINFWLKKDILLSNLIQIDSVKENYGKNEISKAKNILLEHTSPNPQTTIMLGHLRNNFLGMATANLLEFSGAKVTKDAVVNDRGIHICRSIWGYLNFASKKFSVSTEELLTYKEIAEDRISSIVNKSDWKKLLDLWMNDNSNWYTPEDLNLKPDHANLIWYVLGSKAFKKFKKAEIQVKEILVAWEAENPDVWKIWNTILDWSSKGYEETYKRIGSKHDWVWYESELYKGGKGLVEEGLKKGIFQKSEGAVVTNLADHNLADTVVIKSDGTSTYMVFDLNLTNQKIKKFHSDLYIWTIGVEQSHYFKQLFAVCEQLGMGKRDRFYHLSYALINFKGGGKMATREGSVVMADEILDQLEEKTREIIKSSNQDLRANLSEKETSELVKRIALAAIKYSLLKVSRETTIFYDVNESISLEGNSGPYLQYTYARTQSVIRKADYNGYKDYNNYNDYNDEEAKLLRSFVHFSESIENAAKNYSPNLLCNYLYDLAQKFNLFYDKHRILEGVNSEQLLVDCRKENSPATGYRLPATEFRLALTFATGQILKNGLNLLGIQAPERM